MTSSMDERALVKLWHGGGKDGLRIHYKFIATQLQISNEYACSLCTNLGVNDYLDVDRAGYCRFTPKGKACVKNRERSVRREHAFRKAEFQTPSADPEKREREEETRRVAFDVTSVLE